MSITKEDDGSDIVALARAFGLSGFQEKHDAATAEAERSQGDGLDIQSLARAIGLKGFGKDSDHEER